MQLPAPAELARTPRPPPPALTPLSLLLSPRGLPQRSGDHTAAGMPQLSGGGGGDPELCATDEMIPFKDEGDPQKEKIFAEISHPEEEGDLADIKSSLVNESEIIPAANGHEVSAPPPAGDADAREPLGPGPGGGVAVGKLIANSGPAGDATR